MCVCMYVRTHACVYASMHVCTQIHMFSLLLMALLILQNVSPGSIDDGNEEIFVSFRKFSNL